jgi:hypothetical protein
VRWPRRGILIRLLVYGPILGYLGWQAIERWKGERGADSAAQEQPAEPLKRTVTFPDGTKHEVLELTPEQAEQMLGKPLEPPKDDPPAPASGGEK